MLTEVSKHFNIKLTFYRRYLQFFKLGIKTNKRKKIDNLTKTKKKDIRNGGQIMIRIKMETSG